MQIAISHSQILIASVVSSDADDTKPKISCTSKQMVATVADLSILERRVARVHDLFLRHGMCSQRLHLKDGITTMHCWVPPSSGPLLLFVHGFGWDGMVTRANQLEPFMEAGFAVYVPDLVFFGQSTTGSSKRSEAFHADMLRELKVESHVHVVGIIYGGLAALRLASEFPELVRKVMHLNNRDAKLKVFCESRVGTDKGHFQPTLTQEVLLVWGENDRLFETNQGRKLQKHLGSNAALLIIKNIEHTRESEAPRAFNDAVLAFLKDESLHQSRL